MVTFTIVDYWQYDYKFPAQNILMESTDKYLENKEKINKHCDKILKKILDDKNEFTKLVNDCLEFEELFSELIDLFSLFLFDVVLLLFILITLFLF